jgi:hypothetical protein
MFASDFDYYDIGAVAFPVAFRAKDAVSSNSRSALGGYTKEWLPVWRHTNANIKPLHSTQVADD